MSPAGREKITEINELKEVAGTFLFKSYTDARFGGDEAKVLAQYNDCEKRLRMFNQKYSAERFVKDVMVLYIVARAECISRPRFLAPLEGAPVSDRSVLIWQKDGRLVGRYVGDGDSAYLSDEQLDYAWGHAESLDLDVAIEYAARDVAKI